MTEPDDPLAALPPARAQERETWYFECKRLAEGLATQFEERVCDDDGNLTPDAAVDTAFKLIDEFMEEFVKVRAQATQDAQTIQALTDENVVLHNTCGRYEETIQRLTAERDREAKLRRLAGAHTQEVGRRLSEALDELAAIRVRMS